MATNMKAAETAPSRGYQERPTHRLPMEVDVPECWFLLETALAPLTGVCAKPVGRSSCTRTCSRSSATMQLPTIKGHWGFCLTPVFS
eukprot:194337-Amphidinium_carterae.2